MMPLTKTPRTERRAKVFMLSWIAFLVRWWLGSRRLCRGGRRCRMNGRRNLTLRRGSWRRGRRFDAPAFLAAMAGVAHVAPAVVAAQEVLRRVPPGGWCRRERRVRVLDRRRGRGRHRALNARAIEIRHAIRTTLGYGDWPRRRYGRHHGSRRRHGDHRWIRIGHGAEARLRCGRRVTTGVRARPAGPRRRRHGLRNRADVSLRRSTGRAGACVWRAEDGGWGGAPAQLLLGRLRKLQTAGASVWAANTKSWAMTRLVVFGCVAVCAIVVIARVGWRASATM